jgi:hypothetical protein
LGSTSTVHPSCMSVNLVHELGPDWDLLQFAALFPSPCCQHDHGWIMGPSGLDFLEPPNLRIGSY